MGSSSSNPPTSLFPCYPRGSPSPNRFIFPQTHKRKRERHDTGPLWKGFTNVDQLLREAVDKEMATAKETPILYDDRTQLITALRERFKQGQHVDFAGTYRMVDPGVTHKQRIQTITHEIWKATGYRFTVKDHPRIKDGHKTRLICSQDQANKTKTRGKVTRPMINGENLARGRYPCHSRLFLTSRDAGLPGLRLVTVRMHHELSHDPYHDASAPPEVTQTLWRSMGWGHNPSPAEYTGLAPQIDPGSDSDQSSIHETETAPTDADTIISGQYSSSVEGLSPEIYQDRMRKHIAHIRDFCEGLEYQLPFNDYRMLMALETEGASFLRLVEGCLKREGRWDGPIDPTTAPVRTSRSPLTPLETAYEA
ncbi:hypothetical protein BD779DRAFT_1575140 [Infundibulicybe gibba]|nr:hypothetical protein BD779DRAFT_1575140 [Infundibulicybe gibba]